MTTSKEIRPGKEGGATRYPPLGEDLTTYLRQDEGLARVLEGSLQREFPHIDELQQVTPDKIYRHEYQIYMLEHCGASLSELLVNLVNFEIQIFSQDLYTLRMYTNSVHVHSLVH